MAYVVIENVVTVKCDGSGGHWGEGSPGGITHLDQKGYVYCSGHGARRKQHRACRKLRPWELKRILAGKLLAHY